jgi:hypothetical protein
MKSSGVFFMILGVLVLSSGILVCAQTPRQVVDKCVAALGGEEAIRNFSNFKAKGQIRLTYGPRNYIGTLTLVQKGKKYRLVREITVRNTLYILVGAFDGKTAWSERRGTITDQPALNYQSDLDHTPLLLLEKDVSFALAQSTEIEGKRVTVLEVTARGKKTTFFIDQTDYTPREIRYKDLYLTDNYTKEIMEKRICYLDYKKKNGFMFPMRMIFYQEGDKIEYYFQEITFNPEVSPDIFARPHQELDLRYWEEKYD